MGSKIEEARLFPYMPKAFQDCCPMCKTPWAFTKVGSYDGGKRTAIACKNNCFSFCQTQAFCDLQMNTAWAKLWRSFVQSEGLVEAIGLTDPSLLLVLEAAHEALNTGLTASHFETITAKYYEVKAMKRCGEMTPSIFLATKLDGNLHFAVNFQPVGTAVNSTFHYDHGAGTHKNNDAKVLWVA